MKTRTWLKDIRVSAGMTQEAVADQAGVTRAMYGHIETGERGATVLNAKRIAKVLDFEWTLFFEEPCHDLKNKKREKVLSKA
jgi:transcriptional regulator with XRE-family HTH domain